MDSSDQPTPLPAVMYIPAMPSTPNNLAYVQKQKECFERGARPPDYPQGVGEDGWKGTGTTDDIHPAGMHVSPFNSHLTRRS